jgi:uncharacterized protein (UPF0261 family)
MKASLLMATMDTKSKEVLFVEGICKESGIPTIFLDVRIMGESTVPTTICREEVARSGGMALTEVRRLGHEGKAPAV